jgi:hypothetical protein
VIETALEEEITEHLGHEKHCSVGSATGNVPIGTRPKTVLTTPRAGADRGAGGPGRDVRAAAGQGAQRRLTGVDAMSDTAVAGIGVEGVVVQAFVLIWSPGAYPWDDHERAVEVTARREVWRQIGQSAAAGGETWWRMGERSAATATERASFGSFLFEVPVESSWTRAPSLGSTSRTCSPAARSCWASRCPRPPALDGPGPLRPVRRPFQQLVRFRRTSADWQLAEPRSAARR